MGQCSSMKYTVLILMLLCIIVTYVVQVTLTVESYLKELQALRHLSRSTFFPTSHPINFYESGFNR